MERNTDYLRNTRKPSHCQSRATSDHGYSLDCEVTGLYY
jgi:hypothetical protein